MILQEEESIELNKRPHRRPPRQAPLPPPQLMFCAFVFWTALSFAASIVLCSGYWLPYWIRGSFHQVIDVSFGAFRRCNYPALDDNGRIQIVPKCGRYVTFDDIPAFSWKLTTILVGIGAASSVLVSFILLFACCMPHSLRSSNGRKLVFLQFSSFMLILTGCALYPLGWANQEMRDVCGSMPYELGTCELSLSAYLLGVGLIALLVCILFGLISTRKLNNYTNKYDNLVILNQH